MKQTTFASLAWNAKGRTTRRERFLAEMNAVMPWARGKMPSPHDRRKLPWRSNTIIGCAPRLKA